MEELQGSENPGNSLILPDFMIWGLGQGEGGLSSWVLLSSFEKIMRPLRLIPTFKTLYSLTIDAFNLIIAN